MLHIEKIEAVRRRAPRVPPIQDVNNADIMLGMVLLVLTIVFVVGIVVWGVRSHL